MQQKQKQKQSEPSRGLDSASDHSPLGDTAPSIVPAREGSGQKETKGNETPADADAADRSSCRGAALTVA